MNEAWAAIIAAIAAGVFGIGGVFAGVIVGRRQTADQARIEHGHWLREQRLQAYNGLILVWNDIINDLRAYENAWDEEVEAYQEHGGPLSLSVLAGRKTDEALRTLRPAVERVELLGPPTASSEPIETLWNAWRAMAAVLEEQASAEPYTTLYDAWQRALTKALIARGTFHVAASEVLRTPPSPKGEPLL
ncbi:hypothetical protein ACIP5U_34320 [Streptomyces sp. NPDC088788]|uniref:hypothetical protein n=1 Tax=Streptomyces sp. NPDC088788 TaxID=3365898 RepID=UPI003816E53C